jgi:AcrR family transcriptional regulator
MVARTDPRAESRLPLNRERVLRAALALADAGGIESLTMRKLGQELGVEAMSLYNHVANKDDILDGIVDLVFSQSGGRPCVGEPSQLMKLFCATPGLPA